ncbi:MAG: hypothetical protein AAGA10_31385 [Bacteroidota bacterium]
MPSLQVRNVPEALYQALKAAAKRERRSINQQAIVALEKGLEDQTELNLHRKKILDKIESEKERWKDWNSLDIVKLIREDRES